MRITFGRRYKRVGQKKEMIPGAVGIMAFVSLSATGYSWAPKGRFGR